MADKASGLPGDQPCAATVWLPQSESPAQAGRGYFGGNKRHGGVREVPSGLGVLCQGMGTKVNRSFVWSAGPHACLCTLSCLCNVRQTYHRLVPLCQPGELTVKDL